MRFGGVSMNLPDSLCFGQETDPFMSDMLKGKADSPCRIIIEIHKTLHAGAPYDKQEQFLMEPFEKDIHVLLRLPVQDSRAHRSTAGCLPSLAKK
jgi:hypothetical protein